MTGIRTPAPFESRPAGLSEPLPSSSSSDLPLSPGSSLSFATSSPATESTESVGTVRPVETITMNTLHDMLARVLEQTNALWRAQASTNHILDEIRRSIPAPKESAEIHERLRRVEALAGTLAHGQRADLHPPTQTGVSAQETAHHMDPILHASCEQCHTFGPNLRVHHDEEDDEEVPPTIPPLGHIDQSTAEPQHGSELTTQVLPSAIAEDRDRPLGVPDRQVSLTSHVHVPSRPANIVPEDILHVRQEQLDAEREPSIPFHRNLHEASTIEPIQSTTQDTTSERAFDSLEVTQREIERMGRWKEEYGRQRQELVDMASWLVEDQAAAKQREEHHKEAIKDSLTIEQTFSEIRKWDVEHRELLQNFADTWRADSERQNAEIINAVRATANEQVPYNIQGYLDEFIKALSIEVRMLMSEVGNLGEERRRIQHEIGYLMMMQSTLAPGGEFGAGRPREHSSPHAWPSPAGIPLPESPQPRPGWRAVSLRGNRHAPRPESPPPPAPERQVHSWVTWQPNPALAPTPPSVVPELWVPDRGSPGLFGPRSPRDSNPREMEEPDSPNSVHSWVTWQPNPPLAPTPPSIGPNLPVPDHELESPRTFGFRMF